MKEVIKTKTIGIVGYGFLGQAFEYAFSPKCNIKINDPAFELDDKKFFKKIDLVRSSDLIIVGVPTPYSLSEGYIGTIMDNVLIELNKCAVYANKRPVVLIKSAILPTHVKEATEKYKSLDILVSPEYLSAKDSIADNIFSNIHIIGGSEEGYEVIKDIILNHSILNCTWSNPKIGRCSAVDAAMIKYQENCFLALKCVFMSEFYKLHEKVKTDDSVDFNEILRLWQLDPRMGNYPYKIPFEGELGFCSGCLCKDEQAIRDEANALGTPLSLIDKMHDINEELRKDLKNPHNRCGDKPMEIWE